jgi:hypothetical protein
MTVRTFSARDLIRLPNLTAVETIALITQLHSEAQAQAPLPESVAEALEDVITQRTQLEEALQSRQRLQFNPDSQVAREADHSMDLAWSAVRDLVTAWRKVPAGTAPSADSLAALERDLFPDGLSFTTRAYRVEWTESELRLKTIATAGHERTFSQMGATGFLQHLRQSHEHYGKVLGITAASAPSETDATVRKVLTSTHDALREYVTQVAGSVRRRDPSTQARADRLLGPLTRWPTLPRRTLADGAPVPPTDDEPTDPGGPTEPAEPT